MKSFPLLALAALALTSCALKQSNARGAGQRASALPIASPAQGRGLFMKNCAHCHGADGRGDEGPDLHGLDWRDEQIAARIRNGKQNEMTAFGTKFSAEEIRAVIAYLRELK